MTDKTARTVPYAPKPITYRTSDELTAIAEIGQMAGVMGHALPPHLVDRIDTVMHLTGEVFGPELDAVWADVEDAFCAHTGISYRRWTEVAPEPYAPKLSGKPYEPIAYREDDLGNAGRGHLLGDR